MTELLHKVAVAGPVLLALLIMWWRTTRIASAHRKIAEQQKQIDELLAVKAEIEKIRKTNVYEWLHLKTARG